MNRASLTLKRGHWRSFSGDFWSVSRVAVVGIALAAGPVAGFAAEGDDPSRPPPASRTVDFVRDVEPLLAEHCHHCHGPEQQQGRLRLDARRVVFAGGISGPAVVPGDASKSLLVQRLLSEDHGPRMPSDGDPLNAAAIDIIRAWIDQGAAWPESAGSPAADVPIHWAYKRPQRPPLPAVADPAWCRTPVDFFVHESLTKRELRPSPAADSAAWLRRVSLDLVGLPPTVAELDAFLADPSPTARELVVDRLLASPHFGERWAQPWLDAARYGDSTGYHDDDLRASWAYRDWVIAALNADMPFDRFTIEQLAGDLLPEPTLQQRIATGFHRAAPCNLEAGTPAEARRVAQVIDRVNVTATVWLGTTLECARCHNHKHDPFSQRDYYRFFAYFNSTPDETGGDGGGGRSLMGGPTVEVGDTTTFVMQELDAPRPTQILLRGNYETPGEAVDPGLPRALPISAGELPSNRLGLARWLVDPANPLTARVTVNRWWAELFGRGLVSTVEDFGIHGERPTHPELLDWLAVELVENGWSMKQLLRQIVLSAVYSQSSAATPAAREADPDGRWFSRAPRLRLPAEMVRDNALAIAGVLTADVGGPPSYPPQPDGLWWIRDGHSPVYRPAIGTDRYRRGIYTVWRRLSLHPSLAVFDAPDRVACYAQRVRTNTPLQALTLLNDPAFMEAAFALANRLADRPSVRPEAPSVASIAFAANYGAVIAGLQPIVTGPLAGSAAPLRAAGDIRFGEGPFAICRDGRLDSGSAPPVSGWSVSLWFRNELSEDERPVTAYLVSRGVDGSTDTGDHLGIGGTHRADLRGRLFVFNGNARGGVVAGRRLLEPRRWHHVVMVRDGAKVRVFLDGAAVPDIDGELEQATVGEESMFFAARADMFAPLRGAVAHAAVFDRAISAEEARRLWKSATPPADAPPETTSPLSGDIEAGIRNGYRMATARWPTAAEAAPLQALFYGRRDHYRSNPEAAALLLDSVRGGLVAVPLRDDDEAATLAAWFHVATALLNLDETVTRE
jgi:hypothetical protein